MRIEYVKEIKIQFLIDIKNYNIMAELIYLFCTGIAAGIELCHAKSHPMTDLRRVKGRHN